MTVIIAVVTYEKVGLGCTLSKLLFQILWRICYEYGKGVECYYIGNQVQEIDLVGEQTLQRWPKI